MSEEPQVTVLTDAEAAEMTRLHTTRSIECGAMTTHLMCAGCDDAAMEGGGPCQHDCHTLTLDDLADDALLDLNALSGTVSRDDAVMLAAVTGGGIRSQELQVEYADEQPDDLTRFIAEEMRDPGFAHAWLASQARDVKAAYERGVAETAAKIALETRRELVCCDIYDRLAPLRAEVEAAKPGWGEAYREWLDGIGEHDICYWSEASARIAESVGRGDRD